MHRSQTRTSAWAISALAAWILVVALAAGLVGGTSSANAQDGMVTSRGDPTAEAEEREKLFADLVDAPNSQEAHALTSKIWTLWFRAPNEAAGLLMQEALDHRGARDYPGAAAVLDKLVESAPDWAEGWNQRATIRYLLRDFHGSLADIDRVLALEPKHFGALSGQALILMHQGKMAAGQLVLRKAVGIHPFLSERALLMGPAGQDI